MATTYTWDSANWLPASFSAWVEHNQKVFTGPYGATPQVVDLLGDLWNFTMDLPDGADQAEAAELQAFFERLRGALNVLELPMFHRLVPRGTMRDGGTVNVVNGSLAAVSVINGSAAAVTVRGGDAVLAYPIAKGDRSFTISTRPGKTLLEGDFVGLANGQTVMQTLDATADANGLLLVTNSPRMRDALAAGTPVLWNAPTVKYRLKTGAVPMVFRRGRYDGPSIEGIEVPSNVL